MNPAYQPSSFASRTLNATLWTLQIVWGVFFGFTGFGKMLCYRADVWNLTLHQPVPWFHAVPQSLFVFIGVCEFLGGVGLILPALTRVRTQLTPLAGAGLALIMLLAAVFHIARGEYAWFLPLNLILASVSAFIAYGRWVASPLRASSVSVRRMVTGFAVLAALAFVGFAPVWYQLAHTH